MITTPPITFALPPPLSILQAYNLSLPASQQHPSIPPTLLAAFAVRESVFCNEQGVVPVKHHIDCEDGRACQWVLFSPSSPAPKPIGTIRLIPPPHHPHPEPGSKIEIPDPLPARPGAGELFGGMLPVWKDGDEEEMYVQLGRMCVLKEERGRGYAGLLVRAAISWVGSREGRVWVQKVMDEAGGSEREWKGKLLIHARNERGVRGMWERAGFVVDESMGKWWEVGIEHVCMRLRVVLEGVVV